MLTSYEEVEAALGQVPGVAEVSVGAGRDPGKGKLSIRLEPGHDARAVSVAVSEVLRERFGIQLPPDRIQPRPADERSSDAGAPSGNGHVSPLRRAAIRELVIDESGLEVSTMAILEVEGREVRGTATGAATREARLRAVARATLAAVDHLVPGRAKTDLESVEIAGHGRSRHVTVTVTYLTTTGGAQRLAGVSLLDDGELEAAAMRATLDAVNRRVEQLL